MNDFDWEFYIFLYDDLKHIKTKEDLYYHYINYGIKENRYNNKLLYNDFDWEFYVFLYNDLKDINNKKYAFIHYINYGINENRIYNKLLYDNFDWEFYIFLYNDLKDINNKKDAFIHYINHGINENRVFDKILYETFDWEFYIFIYNDLNIKTKKEAYINYLNNINKEYLFNISFYKKFDYDFYSFIYSNLFFQNKKEAFIHYLSQNIKKDINLEHIYKEFDWEFYLFLYSELDIINNKKDTFIHYINNNINNIYNKNFYDNFDWEFYIFLYDDINKDFSKKNIFLHYLNIGINENRLIDKKIYDNFNYELYINNNNININNNNINIDIHSLNIKKDIFIDYIKSNKKEEIYNLDFYYNFDWNFYVFINDDLKDIKTKENAFNHYINYGIKENRIFDKNKYNNFDWKLYLKLYPDIINIGINDHKKSYIHFINNNIKNDAFDWELYLELYPDLKNNGIDTSEKAYLHWLNNGKSENRTIHKYKNFNWKFYSFFYKLDNITNEKDALNDYILYGKKLNRNIINKDIYNDFINFNWKKYIKLYKNELIDIDTKEKAFNHWNNFGKKDGKIFFNNYDKTINDKSFGISISVYSDENTDPIRILCSKICLNSIIKIFYNVKIIIIIDFSITEDHYNFIINLIKNNPNIYLYKNKKNYGISKTKNIGISLLKEENIQYMCLLDDDIEILKDFSNYIKNIFETTDIPLLSNYNNRIPFSNITYNDIEFIETENYYGNLIIINEKYFNKYGYYADFPYKWGEEHIEITKRYLKNTIFNNYALKIDDYINNQQIINGIDTLHLHSINIDFEKVKENTILMNIMLKDINYVDFSLNKCEIERII